MRIQLAHQTAKLMAEEGITDHAFAKRKAARQLGAADTKHLPSNQEIDEALNSYRALYQQERHPAILRRLREDALAAMESLAPFHPWLTGSVLSGMAGEHSDINLIIYSDDAKSVLLNLLNRNVQFDDSEWKTTIGGHPETVPCYTLAGESGFPIHVVILPERSRHNGGRQREGRTDTAGLKELLARSEPQA